jgi:hypothetical protein
MTNKVETPQAIEAPARVKKIQDLTPYLGGREYDRKVLITEAKHYCQGLVECMLEAGKCLICLKQMEGHGSFMEALEEIGVPYQRANELMSIAFFVTNHLLSKLPDSGNLKRLETMGKTRLLLLSRIPDDVLAQFGEEGEVLGKTIDEVAAMPLDQLRDAVRELREQLKNGKMQVRRLQEKNDKMQGQLEAKHGETDLFKDFKNRTDQIFSALTQALGMMMDKGMPGAELFDGESAAPAHGHVHKIDSILERMMDQWERVLKGETWVVE